MTQDRNYNLDSDITCYDYVSKNGVNDIDINVNIPDFSKSIDEVTIDLSKYKNNKPIRKIIRGSIINE